MLLLSSITHAGLVSRQKEREELATSLRVIMVGTILSHYWAVALSLVTVHGDSDGVLESVSV